VSTATLRRELAKMRDLAATRLGAAPSPLLARIRRDPALTMREAGLPPDPWQADLLRSPSRRTLLLCSRQAGKSQAAAALALNTALLEPCGLVLLLSPTLRQSAELFRKVTELYGALGRPVGTVGPRDNVLKLELANGSRVISLPGAEGTTRGYSRPRLVLVDEAARVGDALYRSCRPMLAVSPRGQLVCLSTPFGKRGWFYSEWTGSGPWRRVRVTADQVRRIPPSFLEEERLALGERWFLQEYMCSFEETVDAVFRQEDIDAACADVPPLFGCGGGP
jgi:hypothetical protein